MLLAVDDPGRRADAGHAFDDGPIEPLAADLAPLGDLSFSTGPSSLARPQTNRQLRGSSSELAALDVCVGAMASL